MRALIQRVTTASVSVNGCSVASIGPGLLVLAGIHGSDTAEDRQYIIGKILGARIFDDDAGIMNRSVTDVGGAVLLVSQFTLYGDLRKGRRPSWSDAMPPDQARGFFEQFVRECGELYERVSSGLFGAHMQVSLVNDGPVSILLDSAKNF